MNGEMSEETKRCPLCKTPCVRSMCEYHLAQAAKKWREHTAKRKALGQCVKCHRKGMMLKGKRSVHCRVHQAVNASKCRDWGRENYRRIIDQRKAKGICIGGDKHGPPVPGHVYCAGCRQRNNTWKRSQGIKVKVSAYSFGKFKRVTIPAVAVAYPEVPPMRPDLIATSLGPVA